MRSASLLACLLLVMVPAALSAAAQPMRPCSECHKKIGAGKVVHAALGMGCETCHAAPHAAKKPALSLVAAVPDLCFNCHDRALFSKASVHAPVSSGGCTSCHDPHASVNPVLLTQPVPYVCEQCHQDKSDGKHVLAGGYGLGGTHPIKGRRDPSRKGKELSCRSCHEPHASSRSFLFPETLAAGGPICTGCHERVTVRP